MNKQDGWGRIAGLLEIVRRNPGSTAAALGILIALRQTGAFSRTVAPPTTSNERQRPLIPRAICQYWDGVEPPTDIRGMIDGWITAHPDHRHTLYNDTTALQFLRDHGVADVPKAFLKTRDRAQRADLFRMAYLYARGGIYIDADDRCRGALDQVIKPGDALVVFQEDYGSIANNFIAVAPAHPMIKRALTQATEAILRGDRDIVWLSTGPGMFSRAIATELAEPATPIDRVLQNVTVLDRHVVRRTLVPYCQASYKRTVRHWQNTAFPSAPAVKPKGDAAALASSPTPKVTI